MANQKKAKGERRVQIFPNVKEKYVDALGGKNECKLLCEQYIEFKAEQKLKDDTTTA